MNYGLEKPKLSFLKVWGCDTYVKRLQPDKLEPKSKKCVFIGYPKETIGYTLYHRSEGKIFVAKNRSVDDVIWLVSMGQINFIIDPTNQLMHSFNIAVIYIRLTRFQGCVELAYFCHEYLLTYLVC